MYERFSEDARRALQLANREAQRFNSEYIATEHILLGLMQDISGAAARLLERFNVKPYQVVREIERIIQPGPGLPFGPCLLETPRAKKIIECAIEEARDVHHDVVGSEHLLLALMRDKDV